VDRQERGPRRKKMRATATVKEGIGDEDKPTGAELRSIKEK